MSSARVSCTLDGYTSPGLTTEERDQLRRSKRKAKSGEESQDSFVPETPTSQIKVAENIETQKEPFDTATAMAMRRPLVSYKDVCKGINGGNNDEEEEEEVWRPKYGDSDIWESEEEEVEPKESKENNPLCPVVHLSNEEFRGVCQPWARSLIVKLLGKRLSMRFLQARVLKLWKPSGGMEFIDLENDYFLVRFEESSDALKVLLGGPWMILDHYLIVQKWRPAFQPYGEELNRVAVWVRIPGLPIEFYDKHVLWRIGNVLGHFLKVDDNTLRKNDSIRKEQYVTERAKFARVCIEVDLHKTLVSQFELRNRVYTVEYEGLHLICFKCGCYGHHQDQCKVTSEEINASNIPFSLLPN